MVLYLLASVVGVVVIVLLVVHLTKTGTNTPAAGSSTPASTSTAGTQGSVYVLAAAPSAGSYKLNAAATRDYSRQAKNQIASVVDQIRASGAGRSRGDVVAVYDLGSVTSPSSPDFKAVAFVGFEGTFNPAAVIRYEQTQLVSTRIVSAGRNGGEMMCGYNRSTGSDASECLWVTKTTFGQVEFIVGQTLVKYPGAPDIALTVRQAVETPGV
jgi:hypothetical protein